VKKVLHHTLALRGRCVRVVLVCEVDESDKRNESKSNLTIPAPESIFTPSLRRSARLQSSLVSIFLPCTWEYVSNTKPMPKMATGAFLTTVLRLCLSRDDFRHI
jgi:hypothetical protein